MSMSIQSDLEVRLRDAERKLERLALEGLHSGEAVVGDDAYWDAKMQRVRDRAAQER